MHQYAYGATYKKITGSQFILPSDWEGTKLFKRQYHKVLKIEELRHELNQARPQYHTDKAHQKHITKFFPDALKINPHVAPENYGKYDIPVYFNSLCAYSSLTFKRMSKKHLLEVFEFSDEVKETESYKYWSNIQGTYDIAHLRRGDIANIEYNKTNVQGYSVISKDSYYKAFEQYGFDKDKIIWISDDNTGIWHEQEQSKKLGWSYPVGSHYQKGIVFDWLDDFLKLYFARTIFRANSSFSWWAAFLSPTAKVYSPILDKQIIYGVDAIEEIDVEFIEGNSPHWMYNKDEIKYIDIPD